MVKKISKRLALKLWWDEQKEKHKKNMEKERLATYNGPVELIYVDQSGEIAPDPFTNWEALRREIEDMHEIGVVIAYEEGTCNIVGHYVPRVIFMRLSDKEAAALPKPDRA